MKLEQFIIIVHNLLLFCVSTKLTCNNCNWVTCCEPLAFSYCLRHVPTPSVQSHHEICWLSYGTPVLFEACTNPCMACVCGLLIAQSPTEGPAGSKEACTILHEQQPHLFQASASVPSIRICSKHPHLFQAPASVPSTQQLSHGRERTTSVWIEKKHLQNAASWNDFKLCKR